MSCCPQFENRGFWLFRQFAMSGGKPPSFCPWCGKGITTAPVSKVQQIRVADPMKLIGAAGARRALVQAKDWPKGRPDCPTCKGQGWVLKRIGCCQIKPTPCSCLKTPTPEVKP